MIGIGLLILCAVAILNSWVALLIVCVTLFVYRYHAGWLFGLGVLVDGYFGTFSSLPMYSLAFGGFALIIEVLKLRLIGVQLKHE